MPGFLPFLLSLRFGLSDCSKDSSLSSNSLVLGKGLSSVSAFLLCRFDMDGPEIKCKCKGLQISIALTCMRMRTVTKEHDKLEH